MKKKAAFHTLGCKLNFTETSTIGDLFLKNDYEIVDFSDTADVYVINTCTVTENADKECRQIVRRALRTNPDAFVAVIGCYAQLKPEEVSGIKGVDVVLGSNEKFKIFSLVDNFKKNDISRIYVSDTDEMSAFYSASSSDADSRTRAFFKIQDGCDYKCTFCTIPLARGESRSLNPAEVVSQFKSLINRGYKEIILTGVNVGDYGSSVQKDFYKLLKELIEIKGEYRIRISSIEPNLLSDDILLLTADNPAICNHFHIPLQSGSPKVLQLMKRRYKISDYEKLIDRALNTISNVGLGVDIIVGFPGESEEEFLKTYNFVRELPVMYFHVFTYSERPNTPAINFSGRVDIAERKRRNKMLRILSDKKRYEFYTSMYGKELKVLFEEEKYNGYMKGFTSNYVRIKYPFNSDLVNKLKNVKITGVDDGVCTADLINFSPEQILTG